jgi:transposase
VHAGEVVAVCWRKGGSERRGDAMALGRSGPRQESMWIATESVARSPGHPFYDRLNEVVRGAGFDRFAEDQCAPYYARNKGRHSIPPGVYFRMLFVGYFEGLDSQRAIAWRCADSLALRSFLGLRLSERSPDHSSLTVIRQRLPLEVHQSVFRFVLGMLEEAGLLRGRTLAVDTTTLEANAAMRSIVRRDTGEGWAEYIRRLAQEDGIENPTDEDARRHDRKRKKKVSNSEWVSETDPEAKIAKMKDGRTHLAYKASHAVDLQSDAVVSVEIHPADVGDAQTLVELTCAAERELAEAGHEAPLQEVVADKGFHSAQALAECAAEGIRTYIPEPRSRGRRRWQGKPRAWREAVLGNRRRMKGTRGRALQRKRSEFVERSFAHSCETGGARRTWLRGFEKIRKRYCIHIAGRNLGLLMRACFGIGTPRSLQGSEYDEFGYRPTWGSAILNLCFTLSGAVIFLIRFHRSLRSHGTHPSMDAAFCVGPTAA